MGTLLIIDDSQVVRDELIAIISGSGEFRRFLQAPDGATGLKILSDDKENVDVVACDLNMPIMDGFQFLRMARANARLMNIPIVMVTSESDVSEVVKAFDLGANDFIVKPFNPSLLKVRLKNMLHIKRLQDQLKAQKEMMEAMATTDTLTGIPNLRFFMQAMDDKFHRTRRYEDSFSLLMIDLDHFKKVNDTYGHPRGDSVLVESAQVLLSAIRKVDMVARYGGEEFVVIMPHTDREGAKIAGERVRAAFEARHFNGLPERGSLTVSVGAATFDVEKDHSVTQFIERADKALYAAKRGGRNRVEISIQEP
ncbi:MAG: diguanylate cyclase [bacterium]|nr:diguanylate cyclase [bacterium]